MTETSAQSENRLIAERREKLGRLREKGSAFPNDFRRDSIAAELHAAYGEHEAESLEAESPMVHVAGRMMAKRVMGKVSFINIQDRSGQIQLFVQRDHITPELYQEFLRLAGPFVLWVQLNPGFSACTPDNNGSVADLVLYPVL